MGSLQWKMDNSTFHRSGVAKNNTDGPLGSGFQSYLLTVPRTPSWTVACKPPDQTSWVAKEKLQKGMAFELAWMA